MRLGLEREKVYEINDIGHILCFDDVANLRLLPFEISFWLSIEMCH